MCLFFTSSSKYKCERQQLTMKKILITHSYFLRFDAKQWETGRPYPPLGTLYGASILRELGCDVSFFDVMFAKSPEDIIAVLDKKNPEIFVIYDDGFNYLTKMCLTNMREAAFSMIRFAKESGCIIIVSSSDSTDQFKSYLDKGADIVILGEAEDTLANVVKNLDSGWSETEGIAYKDPY